MLRMDEASGSLSSYVDLEERVPAGHPLRKIRQIVNDDALARLDAEFDALYTDFGRPCLGHRHAPLGHELHRLELELADELPSRHIHSPVPWSRSCLRVHGTGSRPTGTFFRTARRKCQLTYARASA